MRKKREKGQDCLQILGMWSHITNAKYEVRERRAWSDYAETRRHRSDWMYATRGGAGGAHAAQAGAMAAYQYQDVLRVNTGTSRRRCGLLQVERVQKYGK